MEDAHAAGLQCLAADTRRICASIRQVLAVKLSAIRVGTPSHWYGLNLHHQAGAALDIGVTVAQPLNNSFKVSRFQGSNLQAWLAGHLTLAVALRMMRQHVGGVNSTRSAAQLMQRIMHQAHSEIMQARRMQAVGNLRLHDA